MQNSRFVRVGIAALGLNLVVLGLNRVATADIITDGSLGAGGPLLGPNYQIGAELGRKIGPNLFHSFHDFQLNAGESANFSGPASIRNILSRVTGGIPSVIDGSLNSSIAGANFFFINPAGTVFGPNAAINVGGSFVVSSADIVKLGPLGSFYASDSATSFLTSAPPSAFGFLTPNPQPIQFYGSQIGVAPGRSFSVIGGGIGVFDGSMLASTGGLNLVSVGSEGGVSLNADSANSSIGFSGFSELGPIAVTNGSVLRVAGAGTVTLRGQDLGLDNSGIGASNNNSNPIRPGTIDIGLTGALSSQHAGIIQALTSDASDGPSIVIRAQQIVLGEQSTIESVTQVTGKGGDILIEAGQLQLLNAASIDSTTQGKGQGGAIHVRVDDLQAHGNGAATGFFATTQGSGAGGDLNISAKNIHLDKAAISTNSLGAGRGGALRIDADTLVVDGGQTNLAGVGSDAHFGGKGGTVSIRAHDIQLKRGGVISTSTVGTGDGGSIYVVADSVLLVGTSVATGLQAVTAAQGNGGTINLVSGKIQVLGNAAVLASSLGTGDSGNINIKADSLLLDGRNVVLNPHDPLANSGIASESLLQNSGTGGTIAIQARDLQLRHGALITTATNSSKAGGNIIVDAERIQISGQGKVSAITAGTLGGGASGSILLRADSIQLRGDALINSSTDGAGKGGGIRIGASDILLDGTGSQLASGIKSVSAAGATGDGGDININTNRLTVKGQAGIDDSTSSIGNSGNITINAKQIVLDGQGSGDSGISSSSLTNESGNNGIIQITTDDLQVKGDVIIASLTVGRGEGGEIVIKAKKILLDGQNRENARNIVTDTLGSGSKANGGNIEIQADSLTMQNGALVSSNTRSAGQGGNIGITARDAQIKSGAAITALAYATGGGGNIKVDAENLTINGQGATTGFSADTFYFGSQPDDLSNLPKQGNSGTIILNVKKLSMLNGAYVSTSTVSQNGNIATADAGKVTITADEMLVDHSLIASVSTGSGTGGTVDITTPGSLTLNRGQISTRGDLKNAGNIFLKVGDTLRLSNLSRIETQAENDGGSIEIGIGRSFRSNLSLLTAFAGNNGGNITIDSQKGQPIPHDIIVDRSFVSANAFKGMGGKIQFRSKVFLPSAESIISASSTFGTDGTVNIESPNTNVGGSLIALPSNLLGAENYLAERCVIRTTGASSSFTVDAQNGAPRQPGDLLPSPVGP